MDQTICMCTYVYYIYIAIPYEIRWHQIGKHLLSSGLENQHVFFPTDDCACGIFLRIFRQSGPPFNSMLYYHHFGVKPIADFLQFYRIIVELPQNRFIKMLATYGLQNITDMSQN